MTQDASDRLSASHFVTTSTRVPSVPEYAASVWGSWRFHDALIASAGRIFDGGRFLPLISDPSIDIDRASDTPVASLAICHLALPHAKGSIRGPPRPIPPPPREKRWLPRPEVPSLGRQPNPCPQPRFRRWSTDSALHRSRDFATTTRYLDASSLTQDVRFLSVTYATACARPLFTPSGVYPILTLP